ncbi:uncharacterized protein [Pagrus major]|uniref:uncharacterized protein n=1 Tax=Pagrus major TaxID=143350 RepID=UPI003CC8A1A6
MNAEKGHMKSFAALEQQSKSKGRRCGITYHTASKHHEKKPCLTRIEMLKVWGHQGKRLEKQKSKRTSMFKIQRERLMMSWTFRIMVCVLLVRPGLSSQIMNKQEGLMTSTYNMVQRQQNILSQGMIRRRFQRDTVAMQKRLGTQSEQGARDPFDKDHMECADGLAGFERAPSEGASQPLPGLASYHEDDDMLDVGLDVHGLSEDEQEPLSSGQYAAAAAPVDQVDTSFLSPYRRAAEKLEVDWPSPPPAQKLSRFSGFFLPPEPTTVRNNLPMFPDFVAELTSTWNKPLSTCAMVPGYGQFLDLDGAEKAGLVNPPPMEASLAAYLTPAQNHEDCDAREFGTPAGGAANTWSEPTPLGLEQGSATGPPEGDSPSPTVLQGVPAGALPDPCGSSLAGEVVVRRNNQSAGGKALAAPSLQGPRLPGGRRGDSPTPRAVATTCLPVERSNLIAQGLPPNVVATIQSARASSTRGLYAYKWRAFEQWCQDRNVLPFQCSIVDVLTFLQELLDKGLSFSTIKVYLAAISPCHVGFDGVTPGAHPLAMHFLKGVRRLRPVFKPSVPSWDLALVLEALCGPPFEPIESAYIKFLSYQTALLLALTSAKRVGDLHALSVHPSCTQFTPDGSKLTLHPNAAYLPKIIPTAYSSMTFELLSYCPPPFASEEQRRLHSLCPVRALRTYIDRTQGVRLCDQLFVCFANLAKGKALSKQRLSHWIVEAISIAYSSRGIPFPQGVRAHSTRGMAASWALFKGVSVSDICTAASLSSPHTFVRFYRLDVTAPSVAHSVLSAGSTMH